MKEEVTMGLLIQGAYYNNVLHHVFEHFLITRDVHSNDI